MSGGARDGAEQSAGSPRVWPQAAPRVRADVGRPGHPGRFGYLGEHRVGR